MRTRLTLVAAGFALALLGATAVRPSSADMVLDAAGKWVPLPQDARLGGDEEPTDDLLAQSAEVAADATYELVKTNRGFNKPAGLVAKIISSARATSDPFRKALNDASSQFFQEAAEGFMAAASDLQGFGKQDALYLRIQAYASANNGEAAVQAVDDLLVAFPKSYYFADVHILKARVATATGDLQGAEKALAAVKSASGMNPRDLLRADYARVNLTLELQRKYDEAAAEYRRIIAEAEKGDALQTATTRQQALVGLGNCLLALKKDQEARAFFEKAVESRNPDVLAGAYAGLGDIALTEAKGLREGGKLKEAKDALENAVLHYLRVTDMYRPQVSDEGPVLRCLENQAKVFVALFDMSGKKDCELARKAYATYVDLSRSLPDGPQRKGVLRDAVKFDQEREAAGCKGK